MSRGREIAGRGLKTVADQLRGSKRIHAQELEQEGRLSGLGVS